MKHKENEILKKLIKEIKKVVPEAEIILFGSKARGDDNAESDIDLLILIGSNDREKKEKINDVCFQFELEYDILTSPLVHTKEEWHSFPYNVSEIKYFIERDGVRL